MKCLSIFSLVSLLILIPSLSYPKQKKKHQDVSGKSAIHVNNPDKLGLRRNLIILQDDINETNGMVGACTMGLLRALQSEAAPILVSSGLWFNACLYLHEHGNEHHLKPHKKNWELYRVTSEIYCAIPKKYKEKIQFVCKDFPADRGAPEGNQLTRDDIILGIKCSQLKQIESPFAISWSRLFGYRIRLFGNAFTYRAAMTPDVLRKILISSGDIANLNQYPAYDIFMIGHGRASYIFSSVIAGYSISEFHSLLAALNDSFHTHLFMYQTCYGGAAHLVKPFVTNGKADVYNYAIISCCTGAMPSAVYFDSDSKHALDFTSILHDVADVSMREDNFQERLAAFYPSADESPKKRVLHNIPSIRWPGKTEFEALAVPSGTIQVYKAETALAGNVTIDSKQAFLFYDHGVTHAPVILKGTCPALIPMDPTTDVVVISMLDAHEQTFHDVLLHCFAPISMLEVPANTVLIKELQCKLHDDDTASTSLQNVTIKNIRATPIFETPYEQQLDAKYYYNFALRKRVTYEHDGKLYKCTVKPKHGPDFLGKILMVGEAIFANIYGINPHVSQYSILAHDLDPKRLWIFSRERKMRASVASRYEKEFAAHFDEVAIPVAERYQLALATNKNNMADQPVELLKA